MAVINIIGARPTYLPWTMNKVRSKTLVFVRRSQRCQSERGGVIRSWWMTEADGAGRHDSSQCHIRHSKHLEAQPTVEDFQRPYDTYTSEVCPLPEPLHSVAWNESHSLEGIFSLHRAGVLRQLAAPAGVRLQAFCALDGKRYQQGVSLDTARLIPSVMGL